MKKIVILLFLCIIFTSCGEDKDISIIGGADGPTAIKVGERKMYINITPDEAKRIMDSGEEYVLLDVREQNEYDEGHIPGAILIPHDQIREQAESVLTDKDQLILVYCRSGRRSKLASEDLVELGYTNIMEFGGIIDWPYEVEK